MRFRLCMGPGMRYWTLQGCKPYSNMIALVIHPHQLDNYASDTSHALDSGSIDQALGVTISSVVHYIGSSRSGQHL